MGWQDAPQVDAAAAMPAWQSAPPVDQPVPAKRPEAEPPPAAKLPRPGEEGDPSLSGRDISQMARGATSRVLGIPGDLESMALRHLGIKEPTLFPTSEGVDKTLFGPQHNRLNLATGKLPEQEQRDRGYRDLGGMAGTTVAPVLGKLGEAAALRGPAAAASVARGAGNATAAPFRAIGTAFGSGAGKASEGLRTGVLGEAGKAIATKEGEAASLNARAAASRERIASLEAAHRATGATADQARDAVATADARVSQAEQGVQQLEQQLLARPGTTKEEFGGAIRKTAQAIADKFGAIRKKQSGYDEALASAGDELRVDTKPLADSIDAQMKNIRNPTLQSALGRIKDLMQTDGKPGLNIASADSLRKYLNSVIGTKKFGESAVDSESLKVIGAIKKDLTKAATDAWPAYKQALGKWSTLSRPLDIVERNGGLRKVIDKEPDRTDYKMAEAEVVRQVLAGAKKGNPVLSKLVEQNPGIRDTARLHFTQDLFGQGQRPTVARLRTWLKNNEPQLRQLGLYDEFRDIKTARQTAQTAVEEAMGAKAQSMAELNKAADAEKAAKRRAGLARSAKDLAETRPDATLLSQKLVGKEGETVPKLEKAAGQAKGMADDFRKFRTEIARVRPKEVPAKTQAFVSGLRSKGMISDVEYDRYLKQIQDVQDKFGQKAEARKRLIKIGATAGRAAGVGLGIGTAGYIGKELIGR